MAAASSAPPQALHQMAAAADDEHATRLTQFAKSKRTVQTYRAKVKRFALFLLDSERPEWRSPVKCDPKERGFDFEHVDVSELPDEAVMSFFDKLVEPASVLTKQATLQSSQGGQQAEPGAAAPAESDEPYTTDYVRSFKSALVHMYSEQKPPRPQTLPAPLDRKLEKLFKGYTRAMAGLKAAGNAKLTEGKQALSFAGYVLLANKLLALGRSDAAERADRALLDVSSSISELFQNNIISEQELRKKVYSTQFHCSESDMQATGVPPHFVIIRELTVKLDRANAEMNEVKQAVAAVPTEVKEIMLTTFAVNGAIPVQRTDIDGLETRLSAQLRASFADLVVAQQRARQSRIARPCSKNRTFSMKMKHFR
jgi:hypothetical protein